MEETELGQEIKRIARRISAELVAPGFAVDDNTTVLLLNSLISAFHSRRHIYLNAFQRSGEVLIHFGHRLQHADFDVHSLDPRSILPTPQAQDVIITLSGLLQTEPVLVSLLHADRKGLYRFVLTAQSAEETSKRFQGVLPVHIPGSSTDSGGAEELRSILPLGSLFELRSFLYLEAVAEVLLPIVECAAPAAALAGATPPEALLNMLCRAREDCTRVATVMKDLAHAFEEGLNEVSDEALGAFLIRLLAGAREGRAIFVTGYGRNNAVGGMFAHRLANLGIPVAMTPARLERPSVPGDFLVALCGSGSTYEVLQRMSGARRGQLQTAVFTAVSPSPVTELADVAVRLPATLDAQRTIRFSMRQVMPSPPPLPSDSSFSLHTLLLLEATVGALMGHLGKSEADLLHTDPWQGFDLPDAEGHL